jgi:hypothetical protein
LPALRAWLSEYVREVHAPAYADWEVLLNCGALFFFSLLFLLLLTSLLLPSLRLYLTRPSRFPIYL